MSPTANSRGIGDKPCSVPSCANSIRDHSWGHIKAAGWFFSKTGEAYCPEHIPEWVPAWRARARRARATEQPTAPNPDSTSGASAASDAAPSRVVTDETALAWLSDHHNATTMRARIYRLAMPSGFAAALFEAWVAADIDEHRRLSSIYPAAGAVFDAWKQGGLDAAWRWWDAHHPTSDPAARR